MGEHTIDELQRRLVALVKQEGALMKRIAQDQNRLVEVRDEFRRVVDDMEYERMCEDAKAEQ